MFRCGGITDPLMRDKSDNIFPNILFGSQSIYRRVELQSRPNKHASRLNL